MRNPIIYTAMHRLQITRSKRYCELSRMKVLPWNFVVLIYQYRGVSRAGYRLEKLLIFFFWDFFLV